MRTFGVDTASWLPGAVSSTPSGTGRYGDVVADGPEPALPLVAPDPSDDAEASLPSLPEQPASASAPAATNPIRATLVTGDILHSDVEVSDRARRGYLPWWTREVG